MSVVSQAVRSLHARVDSPNDMSCLSLVETLRSLAALEMPCDDCREFGNPQRRPEVNPSNTPFSRLKSFRAGNSEPRGPSPCALVAGRGVEVDTLAMNVALSTGVVADHIEDSDAGAFKLKKELLSATGGGGLAGGGPKCMPFCTTCLDGFRGCL